MGKKNLTLFFIDGYFIVTVVADTGYITEGKNLPVSVSTKI